MKWVIEKEYDGMMIRDYLRSIQSFSRRLLKRAKIDGGEILVNGLPQTVRWLLQAGDMLHVVLPPEEKSLFMEPVQMPLHILYEDEAVLIINKEAGMATIPSFNHPTNTLANGLLGYYQRKNLASTVHIVTRLDRDTSGIVLIAKSQYSHSLLANQQKDGEIDRRYMAVIEGHLPVKNGTIDAPIGRKPGSIIERVVVDSGKHAITHYQTIKETADYTHLSIRLETGRTHQIRVHFSHMGHPLVGDDLYGGRVLPNQIGRQALHCAEIKFRHPLTEETMIFQAEMPADLGLLMDAGIRLEI